MLARLAVGFTTSSLVFVPWLLGSSEAYSARIIIFFLKVSGFVEVLTLDETLFVIGQKGYQIDFWCTPSVLPLCGIALLWFAQQRVWTYLATCIAFTISSALLIFASTVASIHLHQGGMDWTWAHYPGAILVYTGTLIWCGVFAEVRQRKLRQNALETPAA